MGSFSIWHWIVVLAVIAGIVIAVTRLSKSDAKPKGIGGWLILPIIGFIGTLLLTGSNLVPLFVDASGITNVFDGTRPDLASLRLPVLISLLGGALVICSACVVLFLIFGKKPGVRKVATAHYIALASAGFADLWAESVFASASGGASMDPTVIRDAIRGLVIAAVWIPYFQLSKRVQNTFESASIKADQSRDLAVSDVDQGAKK